MHRSGRKGELRGIRAGLPLLFVGLAVLGLVVGAVFGTYIIRSLIDATSPSPGSPPGGAIPGGTTPGGTTPTTPGGTTPGGTTPTTPGGTTPGGSTPTTPGGTTPSGITPGGTGSASVRVQVEARSLLAVQIGAFSERAQAQNVAHEALQRGLPGSVWDPISGQDKLYRVRVGVVSSRQAADALLPSAKAAGYGEAFVATVQMPALDLAVTASSETYLNAFRDAVVNLAALLDAELAAWDAFARGGLTAQSLSAHSSSVNAAANKVRQALAGVTPPADLKERHEVLQGLINMADASALELAEAATGAGGKYPRAMSEFMGFVAAFGQSLHSWR